LNLPVNLEQLTPQQLSLLQDKILARQQELIRQEVERLREENEKLKAQVEIVRHRVDSLDAINIEGDARQRLNRMIGKIAFQNGWTHRRAWKEFKGAYNVSFRTNLTLLHENHMLRTGKKMTLPEFLEEIGRIEDALRVADKMINRPA